MFYDHFYEFCELCTNSTVGRWYGYTIHGYWWDKVKDNQHIFQPQHREREKESVQNEPFALIQTGVNSIGKTRIHFKIEKEREKPRLEKEEEIMYSVVLWMYFGPRACYRSCTFTYRSIHIRWLLLFLFSLGSCVDACNLWHLVFPKRKNKNKIKI